MLIGADGASAQASRPQPRIIVPVTAGSGKLRPFSSCFVVPRLIFLFFFSTPSSYTGRTQKEIVDFVRENYVKRQSFQR